METKITLLELVVGAGGQDFALFAEKIGFTDMPGFGTVQSPPHRTQVALPPELVTQVNAVIDHVITALGATMTREQVKAQMAALLPPAE